MNKLLRRIGIKLKKTNKKVHPFRRPQIEIKRLKNIFLAHNYVKNSRNPSRITQIFALFCTQKVSFSGAKQFWVRDFAT